MVQIVALCLVRHSGRCSGSDRVNVGAMPCYRIVGTDTTSGVGVSVPWRGRWTTIRPARDGSSGCRNHVKAASPVKAVDVEVRVEREDPSVTALLGQGDKCGVGQVHRHIGVLVDQPGAPVDCLR